MIDVKGIGSEGVIILTLFILVKDIIVPLVRRVLAKRQSPNETIRSLNPNSLTLEKLGGILKGHVKYDDERTSEIKGDIKDLRKELSKHGERIAKLEPRSQ